MYLTNVFGMISTYFFRGIPCEISKSIFKEVVEETI